MLALSLGLAIVNFIRFCSGVDRDVPVKMLVLEKVKCGGGKVLVQKRLFSCKGKRHAKQVSTLMLDGERN